MNFRRLLDQVPDGVFRARQDQNLADVNPSAAALPGHIRDNLLQRRAVELVTGLAAADWIPHWRRCCLTDSIGHERIWSCTGGGAPNSMTSSAPAEGEVAPKRQAISTVVGAGKEHAARARMRQPNRSLESTYEGITIIDESWTIQGVNPAFTQITGYSEAEVIGKNLRVLCLDGQATELYRQLWETIRRRGHWQGKVWNRRKSGEIYPAWWSISKIHNEHRKFIHYAGVFTDLTALDEPRQWIERQQRRDELTGLDHRLGLVQAIDNALVATVDRDAAVVVCGLDRFRRINAGLSYEIGNRVLQRIGRRLQRVFGGHHHVGRIGDDRFGLLLIHDDLQPLLRRVLRTIKRQIAQDIRLAGGLTIPVSISSGIALYPKDGQTAEHLLAHAESAMYLAKRQHPGEAVFFNAEQNRLARQTLQLETALRHAIEAGKLTVHYQPIVRLSDRRLVGVEALARWESPVLGQVSPEQFVPLAEEAGLIGTMTRQLLARAVHDTMALRQRFGAQFRLAFNFSATQLDQAHFEDQLLRLLDEAGMEYSGLEMELTERTMMRQTSETRERLRRLRSLGVRLSIDDFGTGFSSLAYLHELDAQTLKIDRRFIAQLGRDPAGERITESIIALAHALGIPVVAEGVETPEQLDRLEALRCDFAQGYLFSPPVPFEALMQLDPFHGRGALPLPAPEQEQ